MKHLTKHKKKWAALLAVLTAFAVMLAACSSSGTSSGTSAASTSSGSSSSELGGLILTADDITIKKSDAYSDDWENSATATITGSGNSVSIDGSGAKSSGGSVTISKEGTYVLSGSFSGTITVDCGDDAKVILVLNGVEITADSGAAIEVKNADKVTISTAAGTDNTVTDVSSRSDETIDAAIYSKADLVLNGEGTLTVEGTFKDAVHSTDDLRITGGTYEITAAGHGLVGRDRLEISDGTFTIQSGGKALKTTNDEEDDLGFVYIAGGTFDITSTDDAIHANTAVWITGGTLNLSTGDDGIHADETLTIDGGTVNVAKSYEGLEAPEIYINGGDISVIADDDGINAAGGGENATADDSASTDSTTSASTTSTSTTSDDTVTADTVGMGGPGNMSGAQPGTQSGSQDGAQNNQMGGGGMETSEGYLTITGGTIYVNASGDGLDANTQIIQTGGDIVVEGPSSNGDGALDTGSYEMSGGSLMALGSTGMLQTISDSSSAHAAVIYFNGSAASGTKISLKDSSGNTVLSCTTTKQAASLIAASAELTEGETYTIYEGSSEVGTVTISGTSAQVQV